MSISIGNREIGEKPDTYIIAEAGVNHNGDLEKAKELIDVAKDAGADAVKFQTFKAKELASKEASKVDYQKEENEEDSQYEMLKELELAKKNFEKLKDYASQKEITFLSTPFEKQSADILEDLEVKAFKIGSGEITNTPLLRHIAKKGKPIILSTGMSDLGEVEDAVDVLKEENAEFVLLHCVSNYPTRPKEVNLRAMDTLEQAFNVPTGFSDHTMDTHIPVAAVARGATVIEKHFTLDKSLEGPDHEASLNPEELEEFITKIRETEEALGTGVKKPAKREKNNKKAIRKGIVASKDIKKGESLEESKISIKRPAEGIKPKHLEQIIGKEAKADMKSDKPINWEDIEV
jgi:N,N'-diacetyllegionaminate synthase